MTEPDRRGLPLADYDHLAPPVLGHRIRSLRPEQISELLRYERLHANRPAVIEIFRTRLGELAKDESLDQKTYFLP